MNVALQFPAPPHPGTVLFVGRQRYELLTWELHQRKTGRVVPLLHWAVQCLDCQAMFVATSAPPNWRLPRRCEAHRQPAKRVTTRGWRNSRHP